MATVNLDTASRLDIVCRRADTFNLTVDFGEDFRNLYDASNFSMDIRDTDTAADVILSLPAAGETSFVWDVQNLTITISSNLMNFDGGEYVYDLQATKDGVVKTLLHGFITVVEDVTE